MNAAAGLAHPALAEGGRPLGGAQLSDRQRMALLFQGVALLSHLRRAGWDLTSGWGLARVDDAAVLRGLSARPAPAQRLAQADAHEWLLRLFGERVPGRGGARAAARRLAEQWARGLVPEHPDALLERVLELAPFLWEPAFAPARQALVAVHHRGGEVAPRLAGPARVRRAFARQGTALDELVASPRARALWLEGWAAGGSECVRRARGQVASATLAASPTPADRLATAAALVALGRYENALALLAKERDPAARLLRAGCLRHLHRFPAARAQLRRLEDVALDGEQLLGAVEIAVTLGHLQGGPDLAQRWLRRALAATRGALRQRVLVESARAACNRADAKGALRALEAARAGLGDPGLARRWRTVRFMAAFFVEHQNEAALSELHGMLRAHRRLLETPDAGRVWNDLALTRAALGDLAGAERALVHAVRLLAGCDGPLPLMAAQNLVEIRLRRGRLRGVVDWLGRALEVDRRNRNLPGITQDLELLARHELVRGRLLAALDRLREALATLDWPRNERYAPELHVLMARAWGWMGQSVEAASALERAGSAAALSAIEVEERPAVLALAGEREAALQEAAGGPFYALWEAALAGQPAPSEAWQTLLGLEEFRAARLVLDLELTRPGLVPVAWQRRACAGLRRAGASGLAARLEGSTHATFRAIAAHCRNAASGRVSLDDLFGRGGYPEARLELVHGGESRVVVAGPGGAEQVETPHEGGRAVLSAPFVDDALRALFALALRDLDRGDVVAETAPDDGLLGESAVLRAALDRAERFARGALPVLVLGESGSGKELVARRIHDRGTRAGQPFVAVNCAATTETLLSSDLFGHARGAFTGADRERRGVFETAHGGTVFLDELGDLPLSAQGMLLRVLQEGEVRRLGESLPRRVDVRVICATHRDLAAMTRRGEFRQDLYYRLKVATVSLPPLRERGDDVLLLGRRFLAAWRPGLRISPAARDVLLRHDWPGNVRELRNVLEAAAALCDGELLLPEHLDLPAGTAARRGAANYHLEVDALRRRLIEESLAASGGRRAEAARRLGLSRQALSYLLRQLGLGGRR